MNPQSPPPKPPRTRKSTTDEGEVSGTIYSAKPQTLPPPPPIIARIPKNTPDQPGVNVKSQSELTSVPTYQISDAPILLLKRNRDGHFHKFFFLIEDDHVTYHKVKSTTSFFTKESEEDKKHAINFGSISIRYSNFL